MCVENTPRQTHPVRTLIVICQPEICVWNMASAANAKSSHDTLMDEFIWYHYEIFHKAKAWYEILSSESFARWLRLER